MKRILTLLLALCMLFAITACSASPATSDPAQSSDAPASDQASDAQTPAAGEKYKIAICAMKADNAWMAKHIELIEEEIKKDTDQFEYTLSVGKHAADQQGIIETFMTQDYDCIIVMPRDSVLLKDVCDRVYDAGIPLIICERPIEGDKYLSFVGASDYDSGRVAGEYFGQVLGGEGKLAVLRNFVGTNNDAQRYAGLTDVLNEKYPGIEIVREADAEASREKGYTMMGDILAACDQIDAVYAQVDEAGLGALQAIENANRTDIRYICGIGGCKEIFDLFGTDSCYTAIASFFPSMGPLAIDVARRYLKGETVEKEIIDPAYLITADNVAEFYDQGV